MVISVNVIDIVMADNCVEQNSVIELDHGKNMYMVCFQIATVLNFTDLVSVCSCSITPTVASLSDRLLFSNEVISYCCSVIS